MPAPTFQDLFDIGRAQAILKRPDLTVLPGDVSEMEIAAGAAMADRVVGYDAGQVAATFLDGASGDALTELADDHWNIQRQEASQAVGQVTFTASSGPVSGTIPAGTRVRTGPDAAGEFQEFTTDVDLVFAAETTKSVAATAVTGGQDGNVAAAAIDRIADTLFDTFTVTNAAAFVGGNPEESDEDLRERVREQNKTLRRATKAALEFGARQVSQVATATVVEDLATGIVTVYVSDSEGNSNATMAAAVETELEQWRAAGVNVTVVGATLVTQAIDFSLVVRTGVDATALVDRVRQAIVSAVNRLRIGETFYRSLAQSAGRNVDPEGILQVTINSPVADVAPAADEVIRTTLANVTSS